MGGGGKLAKCLFLVDEAKENRVVLEVQLYDPRELTRPSEPFFVQPRCEVLPPEACAR